MSSIPYTLVCLYHLCPYLLLLPNLLYAQLFDPCIKNCPPPKNFSRSWHHALCVGSGCNCNTTLCRPMCQITYNIRPFFKLFFCVIYDHVCVTEELCSSFMDIYNIAVNVFPQHTASCCLWDKVRCMSEPFE